MSKKKFFSIKLQECEICGNESQYAMNDKYTNLHFACLIHHDDLYRKINNIDTDLPT